MMKKAVLGMLLAAFALPVLAQDDPQPLPTVNVGGLAEFSDGDRHSDTGWGGFLTLSQPLTERPGEGVELDFHGLTRKADAGGSDTQFGLFANYSKIFGLYGWDDVEGFERHLPAFAPYVLGGVGAMRDDVGGHTHYSPALDVGLGLAFPLSRSGIALRTEGRLFGSFNDKSVDGEDFLLDWQLRVGLSIPLGASAAVDEPPPLEQPHGGAPPRDCGVAVVDPATGRTDCVTDSDRDGVADVADLCPGTPAGTPVDLNGCPPTISEDSDNDGIPDLADDCPNTPPGATVDVFGCSEGAARGLAPPAAAAATGTRLGSIGFGRSSADLTAEARRVLDGIAAQLDRNAEIVLEVAGHTDAEGKTQGNLALSLLRAEYVKRYLVSKGVSHNRLFVAGYGQEHPAADNHTEVGRAQNRRVDLDRLDLKVIEP